MVQPKIDETSDLQQFQIQTFDNEVEQAGASCANMRMAKTLKLPHRDLVNHFQSRSDPLPVDVRG
jgi:hypothetical protein